MEEEIGCHEEEEEGQEGLCGQDVPLCPVGQGLRPCAPVGGQGDAQEGEDEGGVVGEEHPEDLGLESIGHDGGNGGQVDLAGAGQFHGGDHAAQEGGGGDGQAGSLAHWWILPWIFRWVSMPSPISMSATRRFFRKRRASRRWRRKRRSPRAAKEP